VGKKKHILQIFSSKAVAFLVGIVRGYFVPGYLGPKMYGVIHLLKLVKIILGFSSMGFDQAYMRLLPGIKNSSNPETETKELQNTIFSFLLISSILGMIITAFIPLFIKQDTPEMQRLMVFCFSITAVSHFFTLVGSFFVQTQYIAKNFPLISKLNVLQSLLSFGLIMATIFYWKIYGVFLAELVTVIVIQGIYFYQTKIHLQFQLRWEKFKEIFKFSFPFFLSQVGFHFVRLTDRTVITLFLSLKDLGLYGFALNLSNQLRMVSVSINEVMTPHFLEEISTLDSLIKKKRISYGTHTC
jgi:O-antigen/teichoic acid export membrane protein